MRFSIFVLLSFVLCIGCATSQSGTSTNAGGEPSHITVQHCLSGFMGSVPGKDISRTKEEAAELAAELLAKAKAGEDFDAMIVANTDDSPPGIYKMANHGFPGKQSRDVSKMVFKRDGMVPAFGDVGFALEVGEYGMSQHSDDKSPYGFHIVKRIK